LKAFEEAKKRE
jgi:hypothetical protein